MGCGFSSAKIEDLNTVIRQHEETISHCRNKITSLKDRILELNYSILDEQEKSTNFSEMAKENCSKAELLQKNLEEKNALLQQMKDNPEKYFEQQILKIHQDSLRAKAEFDQIRSDMIKYRNEGRLAISKIAKDTLLGYANGRYLSVYKKTSRFTNSPRVPMSDSFSQLSYQLNTACHRILQDGGIILKVSIKDAMGKQVTEPGFFYQSISIGIAVSITVEIEFINAMFYGNNAL